MKASIITTLAAIVLGASTLVAQQQLPPWAAAVIAEDAFISSYARSDKLRPTFLVGDFNGDGREDVAVFVVRNNRASRFSTLVRPERSSWAPVKRSATVVRTLNGWIRGSCTQNRRTRKAHYQKANSRYGATRSSLRKPNPRVHSFTGMARDTAGINSATNTCQ